MPLRRPRNWDATKDVDAAVLSLTVHADNSLLGGVDMHGSRADIDLTQVPRWLEELDLANAMLRERRHEIAALVSDRACGHCGDPMVGRTDRQFCSTRCRVQAHRGRQLNLGQP